MLRHLLKRRSAITLPLHLLSVLQLPIFFCLAHGYILHLHSLLTTYFFTLLALILSWFQSAKKKKNRHIFTYAFYLVFVQKISSVVRLFSKEAHGVVVVVK